MQVSIILLGFAFMFMLWYGIICHKEYKDKIEHIYKRINYLSGVVQEQIHEKNHLDTRIKALEKKNHETEE